MMVWGKRPAAMKSFAARLHCDMLTTVLPGSATIDDQSYAAGQRSPPSTWG
jgi:hypothetical protein